MIDGGPFLLGGQTILVLGTDVRSGAFAGPDEAETENCIEAINSGRPTDNNCKHGPYRSDTIMLVRAGAGTLRKLSIPRDTLADVPGKGPQKINSAYASGGAKLAVRTVEGMLGLDVDQVAIIDFDGFRSFIDSIGGITVDLPYPVCSSVSGGAFKLDLEEGENDLDGYQAITLARTRENTCGEGQFTGTDVERAQFQQFILDGIKSKLTSITSLPMELHQGPADRLERAEGDGLEHGRADDAAAGDRGRDRRRRGRRRAEAVVDHRGRQPRHLTGGVRPRGREAARPQAAASPNCPQSLARSVRLLALALLLAASSPTCSPTSTRPASCRCWSSRPSSRSRWCRSPSP